MVGGLCCVHCGAQAKELYHVFCDSIKLRECTSCGRYVDDLLEVENLIIAVKLFLQKPAVYRHLCVNHTFSLPPQIPITILAMEIFLSWTLCCYVDNFEDTNDAFRWSFFTVIVQTLCSWAVYVTLMYIMLKALSHGDCALSRMLKCIWIASFAKFFNIGIILWSPEDWLHIASNVVEFYWILSQYRMLQCTMKCRSSSRLVALVCCVCAKWIMATSSIPCTLSSLLLNYL